MSEPGDVSFSYFPEPDSFFYDLRVCFGDRCETTGGFAPSGGPEDEMLRAALWVLVGGDQAHVRLDPAQPWGVRMTFRVVPLGRAPNGACRWGCEVSLADLDGDNQPETEPRVLGVTPSVARLARAVLEYAEQRNAEASPYPSLIAMRAALPLIEAHDAERERWRPPGE